MTSARGIDARRDAGSPTDPASPPPGGRHRDWRLHATESSVPALRGQLRAFLAGTGLPADEIDDLILAACEAATNAVEHALRPTEPFYSVSAEVAAGVVTIAVRDHGQWQPPARSSYRGRGLQMMRLLADTTVHSRPEGTTVVMRNHGASLQAPVPQEGRAS